MVLKMSEIFTLPPVGWKECNFDPVRVRDTSRMEGRRTESMTSGTPYWTATLRTTYLSREDFGLMDAFMMRAGEDGEVFLGFDVFRPRPMAMDTGVPLSGTKAGGGAFNGDGALQAITDPRQIVVNGLPANFKLLPGDYVEVRKTPMARSLHRVMEPAQSNASGVVSLKIKYSLDTQNFPVGCTVHFEKPSCTMQIDPDTYSGNKSWSSREPSFSATEVFFS